MIITIEGNPIPWKRPGWRGTKAYDAQKLDKVRYASIARQAMIAQGLADVVLKPGIAFKATYRFEMPIPESWSNQRRLEMVGKDHVVKPDKDNLIKLVMDSLTGIVYYDDCQISRCGGIEKIYSLEPKTIVWIERIE